MLLLFYLIAFLYLAGNAYILYRAGKEYRHLPLSGRLAAGTLYVAGTLSVFPEFMFRRKIEHLDWLSALHPVGTGWLVFTLYMLLFLALAGIARRIGLQLNRPVSLSLFLTVALLAYGNYRYRHPAVRHIDLEIGKTRNKTAPEALTIVAVSDIHLGFGTGKRQLARYVDLINRQKPDVVLIGGDLIDSDIRPVEQNRMDEELRRIDAPLGVYMAPGNHDYFCQIDACRRFAEKAGITFLQDSVVQLPNGVQIAGRDDRHNRNRMPLRELLRETDPDKPVLLIDHQPYDLEETARNGVDLQFSGHTHRGQVWPVSWLTDYLFEVSHGYRQKDKTHIYVSSGLSLWGPPFRIGTESEMVVFSFKGTS